MVADGANTEPSPSANTSRAHFRTFIGVDLGGGKGKTTAVAVLRVENGRAVVQTDGADRGTDWYDSHLVEFLLERADGLRCTARVRVAHAGSRTTAGIAVRSAAVMIAPSRAPG